MAAADDSHDACPSAAFVAAIMLLQEKWSLVIVQSLLQGGPLGFNEMARRAGPVNATTMAQRLGQLERAGVVEKTVHSTMPPRTSYTLTTSGQALAPVLDAISAWAERYPLQPAESSCEPEQPLAPVPTSV